MQAGDNKSRKITQHAELKKMQDAKGAGWSEFTLICQTCVGH